MLTKVHWVVWCANSMVIHIIEFVDAVDLIIIDAE